MMASNQPKDIEALGAEMPMDIQEKQLLREKDQQAVSRPDARPARPRTMATRRRGILALSMCLLATIGLASTYHARMPCHKDGGHVEHAAVDVESSPLSSLLGSNSVESLREILGNYVPGTYGQQEAAQVAKRQADGNSTASVAVTTAVTTVSTPGPTTLVTSSAASAATTPTSSTEAVATTPETTSAAATTPETSSAVATTPTTSAVAATTPTSVSVATTTAVQTSVSTQTQTAAPTTADTTAIPTPSDTASSVVTTTLDTTVATSVTSSSSSASTEAASTSTSVSSTKVIHTLTSTMADGGISVVTQTSYSYVNAEPTGSSTSTRAAASLQTGSAAAAAANPGLAGGFAVAAGLSFYMLGV